MDFKLIEWSVKVVMSFVVLILIIEVIEKRKWLYWSGGMGFNSLEFFYR